MAWYRDHLFPLLLDWAMRRPSLQDERRHAVADAQGSVLEIGFGTGLNLPYYPTAVSSVTAVDPARLLPRRVARRIAAARPPVELLCLSAERLPFNDRQFDCVVSTWTLCTIPEVIMALREVRRVLKPRGRFLFLEHGRSTEETSARWQDRLDPLQQRLAGGCHINRSIDRLLLEAGFTIQRLDRYRSPAAPRIVAAIFAEMYRGIALPTPGKGP
jgi:ubiquinone/menaquinone biosynthesis C-methylase UbiE